MRQHCQQQQGHEAEDQEEQPRQKKSLIHLLDRGHREPRHSRSALNINEISSRILRI